jgi:multisubunit Na+/H+ antiporter MnhE subunit
MRARTAELILLALCVVIALLLLTESVSIEAGAVGFAVALVVLGLASRGFRR